MSTPSSSGSGNITPQSTTMMSSPYSKTIMFMPNSPSPPRGITLSLPLATGELLIGRRNLAGTIVAQAYARPDGVGYGGAVFARHESVRHRPYRGIHRASHERGVLGAASRLHGGRPETLSPRRGAG